MKARIYNPLGGNAGTPLPNSQELLRRLSRNNKNLHDFVVKALMRLLPQKGIVALTKFHYRRLLKAFSEDREIDLMIVRHLVNAGDHVVDVGANIGVYTKFLSQWTQESGLVYSIEPIPKTFEILTANTKRLQMKNVKPINCAISEANGDVIMVIPLDKRGFENHYEARIIGSLGPARGQIRVSAFTLDSLLSELPHPISFIKIDTEGHELQCIKGGLKTLDKWKPSLLVEISSDLDSPGSEGFRLVRLLKDRGYGIWWFDGECLHRRQESDRRRVNYFFLMARHVGKLQENGILMS